MKKIFIIMALGSTCWASPNQNTENNQKEQKSYQYEYQKHPPKNNNPERTYINFYDAEKEDQQIQSSDEKISRKIKGILSSRMFSTGFQTITFNVNNGNVNLSGSVDTPENKNKVEDALRKIDGVKVVISDITVDRRTD